METFVDTLRSTWTFLLLLAFLSLLGFVFFAGS